MGEHNDQLRQEAAWIVLQNLVDEVLDTKVQYITSVMEVLQLYSSVWPSKRFCQKNSYVLSLFLHDNWRKNDYGQVSFYDQNSNEKIENGLPSHEIISSVHPYQRRSVLWPSCSTVLFRPPSVRKFTNLKILHVWF